MTQRDFPFGDVPRIPAEMIPSAPMRGQSKPAPRAEPEPPPFARGSATSKAAAESMREHAWSIETQVLAAIRDAGDRGMTCDEVEAMLGGRHQTISARVHFLAKRRLIIPVEGVTRPTRSGRRAQVYKAAS